RFIAPALGIALFVELAIAITGSGLKAIDTHGPTVELGFGSPTAIGKLLLERFLIAFEAASLLLLIAAVGSVVLAGRHRGEGARGAGMGRGNLKTVSGLPATHPRPPRLRRRPDHGHHLVPGAERAALRDRRLRRPAAAQPARHPALSRADAERREPGAGCLLALAQQPGGAGLRPDRDGDRGLRGRGRPGDHRRRLPAPDSAQ